MLQTATFGDEAAPPIMIVHGLFGSGRNWGVIAKRLSDAARVTTVDLRNHGDSPRGQSHSYHDLADDLAEVIAATQGGAPMAIVGHSMGGKAAMTLALTQPDLLSRLLVADIAPVPYGHSQLRYIEAMRAVDLSTVERRSDAEAQLAEQGIPRALCSFFTQSLDVQNRRWKLNLDVLEDQMPQIMGFPEIDAQFDKPTLFLAGGASDYILPEHRPAIKALFPSAGFAKLRDAGHWLHAEKPREFEAVVRGFATKDA